MPDSPPPPIPEALRTRLQPHIRKAWLPVTEFVDKGAPKPRRLQVVRALSLVARDAPDTEGPVSKLGGRPWLKAGEAWPICPNCQKPIALFLQLDLTSLPEGAPDYGEGLIQLFFCETSEPLCAVDCDSYLPFSRSHVARLLSPEDLQSGGTAPIELAERDAYDHANHVREPQVIVGWKEHQDLPDYEEAVYGGLASPPGVMPKRAKTPPVGIDWDAEGDAIHDAKRPIGGEKLAGWASWIQSVEYPECPTCGGAMRLVFQIDSNDKMGVQFGDLGCGHLTQCPTHKDVLAFTWECH